MKVYTYHPVTGEYMGETTADKSPLEPGKYLLPAHSTETAPPDVEPGKAAVWGEKMWHSVEDHRGRKGYVNGVETEIKDLGPLPEGWGDTLPPPPPPTLEETKAAKLQEIAAARFDAETGGTVYNGITIDTSRESQALITGAALQATIDTAYSCQWKTAEGFVSLTAEMILAVAVTVRRHVQACFDREAELMATVSDLETVEEVQAVRWEV